MIHVRRVSEVLLPWIILARCGEICEGRHIHGIHSAMVVTEMSSPLTSLVHEELEMRLVCVSGPFEPWGAIPLTY